MRDRLGQFQEFQCDGDAETEDGRSLASAEDPDASDVPQNSGTNPDMEAVFDWARTTRYEIELLSLEVKRLAEHNSQMFTGTGWSTDSSPNAIAVDIKRRGRDVLTQLHKMNDLGKEMEEKYGANSAVARIARTQYASISNSFRDAMVEYNEVEMGHRETCKAYITRQMEIVGRDVTGDQIEEMMESGQWNVFSENMGSEGKTARSALVQIESRHAELLELEKRLHSLHEIFLDVAMLVEQQSSMTDHIHTNVQSTEVQVTEILVKLERARRHDRSNPFKKMFFWRR